MKLDRYKPNRRGIQKMLKSPEVLGDLIGRGVEVAAAASAYYELRPPHQGEVEVVVAGSIGDDRARVAVIAKHPGALGIEADRRPLGGALDAAK